MKDKRLEGILRELHAEMERTGPLSDQQQETLLHIKQDVDALLTKTDEGSAQRRLSLSARLQENLAAFEGSHPTLAVTMQKVLDGLSQSGI